jgi:antitoxin (DNA-binding transcriptional repressor) of toxin-antitoxin stability system
MRDSYSLYEAKAKLSALIRMVREGRPVVITVHGEPVVEMRRIEGAGETLEQRLLALEERGVVVRAARNKPALKQVTKRPGALKRFLAERD